MASRRGAGSTRRDFRILLVATIPTFLLILTWAKGSRASEVGPIQTLCVQTMNMYGPAYASDRSLRFTLASDYFAKNGCDVVNLQEVWNEKQFNRLREQPSIKWPFFNARYFGRTKADPSSPRFGMATLTSHEILESKKRVFSVNYDMDSALGSPIEATREAFNIKKGYGVAVISINGMYPIAFINTHLHPTSEIVRLAQTIELLDEVTQYVRRDIAVVVSGDLNTQPGSLELETLRHVGLAKDTLGWSDECTYCFWNKYSIKLALKNVRMDYILLFDSKSIELQTLNSKIAPESHHGFTLSDHYGVQANLMIKTNSQVKQISSKNHVYAQFVLKQAITELSSLAHKPEYHEVLEVAERIQTKLEEDWRSNGHSISNEPWY